MICSNCSNPIDSNTKFCPYCDAAVEEMIESRNLSDASASRSDQLSALTKRYRDAYSVSSLTDVFGNLIKAIAFILAGILVLAGLVMLAQGDATFALGVLTLVLGVVSGLGFYMIGVLVCANAQILKASLDGAVNSSPFLSNEHRAKIMSLPYADALQT